MGAACIRHSLRPPYPGRLATKPKLGRISRREIAARCAFGLFDIRSAGLPMASIVFPAQALLRGTTSDPGCVTPVPLCGPMA
jgi:hypothetical protein